MWLLPTLDRIEKLTAFLKSYAAMECKTKGRVLIDEKDWEKNQGAYVGINNKLLPDGWAIEITKAVTMGGKIREYAPKAPDNTKFLGILNDDHVCASKNCLELLESKLDGKNFVSANDRRPQAFSFPVTATAWSVPLLKALGWPIYPPFLEHLYIDNLWHQLGIQTGCWRMVAGAVVLHDHILWNGKPQDETHKKVYGEEFISSGGAKRSEMYQRDEQNFKIFMQTEFHQAVAKIKEFQDFLPGEQWNPKVREKPQAQA